jgi:hypothetical protein
MTSPVVANLKRLFVWTLALALSAASTGVVWLKGSGQTLREAAVALL